MQVRIFNDERISLTNTNAMVSHYQGMKLQFTLVFKLLSSNCTYRVSDRERIQLCYSDRSLIGFHYSTSNNTRFVRLEKEMSEYGERIIMVYMSLLG